MPRLKAEAKSVIAAIISPGSRTYLTDESVNPVTNTAGTSFVANNTTTFMRVTNNSSSLQVVNCNLESLSSHITEGRTFFLPAFPLCLS